MSRQTILDAILDLVSEEGTDGLSVRAAATRAGVSIGTVQHYFPTKADMLFGAMDVISEAATGSVDAVAEIEDPAERLHRLVDFLIPGDSGDRVARVWLSFAGRAAFDAKVRARYERMWASMRAGISRTVMAADPHLSQEASDEHAVEILALLDGLALTILAESTRTDLVMVRRIAHRRVDQILT